MNSGFHKPFVTSTPFIKITGEAQQATDQSHFCPRVCFVKVTHTELFQGDEVTYNTPIKLGECSCF